MFNQIKKNLAKRPPLSETEEFELVMSGQMSIISRALDIVKKQINDIDAIGNNEVGKDKADELKRSELLTTKKRFLDFFHQIASFLLEKVESEQRSDLRFYLPNVRTLLDIYSKLLYLANHNKDEQMLNCIYERLYFLKGLSAEEEFNKNLLAYKDYLDDASHLVPSYQELSKKKSGAYLFPPTEQMLRDDYICKFQPDGLNKDTQPAKKAYDIYRAFSSYVHGNMLSKDFQGNEDFWIIRNLIFLLSLLSALIDKDVLDNKNKAEIQKWAISLVQQEQTFRDFYDAFRYKGQSNNR